jgi:hypothetical protein
MTFEANLGQTDPKVRFITHGKKYTAFLTAGGIVLSLRPSTIPVVPENNSRADVNKRPHRPATTLRFNLVGASKHSLVTGEDPQLGTVNYFIGNDPQKWHTNIATYGKVRTKDVYPGIDLVYYGNNRQFEYDFEISPGANPNNIQFEVLGARGIHIDDDRSLVLETPSGELRFENPIVYQRSNQQRTIVDGHYVLRDRNHIAFQISHYDPSKPLVIDPVLTYSTYLGGSLDEQPAGIAVDNAGSVYVAGSTDSVDFPLTTLGSLPGGSSHIFVAKLDATGSNLVYADYIGGSGSDFGYALALDASNNVAITGNTDSTDFPTTTNAFQGTYPGGSNAVLTKISASGSSLLYSSYLGGNGTDIPSGVAIDAAGEMIVGGSTSSTNFPIANAYQATAAPNQGGMYGNYGFLSKFNSDGSALLYSTYLGGSANVALDCGGTPCWSSPSNSVAGMAVDKDGNAYVAGTTNTYDFPVSNGAYLSTNSTPENGSVGFVSKFGNSGSLQYSTYFYDPQGIVTAITAIAVDGAGSAYVTGIALGNGTFPITSTGICDPVASGSECNFAFVTKFDATGSTLLYSTFLGPNNNATPRALLLDGNNDAYVMASTQSSVFSIVNGVEGFTNGNDVLLAEIDPAAGTQLFATFLGGNGDDEPAGMAIDASNNLYVLGSTTSSDFPVTQTAYQSALAGASDTFILKIGPASKPAVTMTPHFLQYAVQTAGSTSQAQTVVLRNMGSSPLAIASVSTGSDFAETNDCGSTVAAASSCTFSVTFTPTLSGVRTGSLVIHDDAAGSPHSITLSGTGSGTPGASVAPASLTFSSLPLGTSSAPQTVTVSSTGNLPLSVGTLQATGDFAQTNNCPSTLSPGSACTVAVTFTPTASGSRSGTLTVTSSAQNSPQTIGLTGTGSDFSLRSAPTSNTLKAGATATYTISIANVGGAFTDAVKLSCGGAPTNATCSLSSSSVTPGSSTTATMTVSTTASVAQALPASRRGTYYAFWLPILGTGLFGMLLPGLGARRKKAGVAGLLALLCLILMLMPACAGGTGISPPKNKGTPSGTYTLTVTGTSGSLQHSLPLTLTVQ